MTIVPLDCSVRASNFARALRLLRAALLDALVGGLEGTERDLENRHLLTRSL